MTTATYAGLGAVYTGVGALAENIRATDDMWNRVIGAMTAGSLVGLRTGSLYTSGGAAAALGFMSAAVYLCGGEFGPHDDGVLERRRAMYED